MNPIRSVDDPVGDRALEPPPQPERVCQKCGSRQPVVLCPDCQEPMCDTCGPAILSYYGKCQQCLPHEAKGLVDLLCDCQLAFLRLRVALHKHELDLCDQILVHYLEELQKGGYK